MEEIFRGPCTDALDLRKIWSSEKPQFNSCFLVVASTWLPCGFLWMFLPLELYLVFRSHDRCIPWNWLNTSKLVGYAVLLIMSSIDLVFMWNASLPAAIIITGILQELTYIIGIFITLVHKKYAVRTSGIMFVFWLLTLFLGTIHWMQEMFKCNDGHLLDYAYFSYVFYYPLVVFMFILQFFADSAPMFSLYPPPKNPIPESVASCVSQFFCFWFDSFALKAYSKGVQQTDLWEVDYTDSVKYLTKRFENAWRKSEGKKLWGRKLSRNKLSSSVLRNLHTDRALASKEDVFYKEVTADKPKEVSLLRVLWKRFGAQFLIISITKGVSDVCNLVSPLILSLLINFAQNEEPYWHGYVYCGLLTMATFGQLSGLNWYAYSMFYLGLRIRTTLMSAVYRKALRISNDARRLFTLGEMSNLMSVDAQRFYDLLPYLPPGLSVFYQLGITLYLLYRILGWSALVGYSVLLLGIPINIMAASKAKSFEMKQMKKKDERIKITSEVLSGIKSLKMYAWEDSFEKKICSIRNEEIKLLKHVAYINTGISFMWGSAPFVISAITLATYALSDENNILNASVAFVSLALLNITRTQLMFLPKVITNAIQLLVACNRIHKFLNSEELDTSIVSHSDSEKDPIVIERATFSWSKDDDTSDPTLININVKIPEKSLTAVVGTVGAGKSSLLAALLGEMHKITGYVNVKGRVAYIPQQAWIQNATVKDNILFGSKYEEKFYNKVIEACALDVDFKIFAAGDETEIGEKGVNLSGGQKQRISLARAVYNNADVYLLDDPLSAVDAHVGKHIFEKVIGPRGILRDRTRILVTHAISYLPDVDIIVMMKNGTIHEIDTYEALLTKNEYFSEFLSSAQTSQTDENEKDTGEKQRKRTMSGHKDRQIKEENNVEELYQERGKLTMEEAVEQGEVKWSVYLQYLKQGGLGCWVVCIALHILYNSLVVSSNFWLSQWSTDPVAASVGPETMERRLYYIGTYLVFGSGQFISVFLASLTLYLAALRASAYFHSSILNKVLHWPSYMFDITPVGQILNRLSYDIDLTDNMLPYTLLQLFSVLGTLLATVFVITYTVPAFIVPLIPIVVFYYFLKKVFVTLMRQLTRMERTSRSPVFSHFVESVTGASVIRAYGAIQRFIEEFESRTTYFQSITLPTLLTTRWIGFRLDLTSNALISATALLVVINRFTMSSGIAGLAVCYALQITFAVVFVVRFAADLETNIISVERLKQYDDTPQEKLKGSFRGPLTSWPRRGEIIFQNLKVRYREDMNLVLIGISCKICSGEKVGIVGRTGAGKSSLTLSLFRIIEPAGGCILIDNVDISTLDLYTLRSKITIIPQDPVLFSGSLRFNLDPFEEYTDEAIHRALEVAHWKDSVRSLPNGLYYEVSEYGQNLSVGQRQLLCLARAILRKTKILILDEATAAVDVEMNNLIQQTIRSEFSDCTVLTIAHRLNTIMDADRVMVLEEGAIAEFDAPGVLLKQQNGLFYKMVKDAGLLTQ